VEVSPEKLDEYAATWVDLRPKRMAWWIATFKKMHESRTTRLGESWATAQVNRATYISDRIEIGSVVAWIFSTQDEGFRLL
jgi:hypothetical protein